MSKKKTFEEFLTEYLEKHGCLKYFFDEETYVNTHTPMRVICEKHGEFWKTPKNMMRYGCQKCAREEVGKMCRLTKEQFIEKAIEVHGLKYDYSEVKYITSKTEVKINCPIHGSFYQKPNNHLSGKGCKFCNDSHLERKVKTFLDEKNVEYIYQYRVEWLGKQSLDFYIPSLSLGIECQGKQHFGRGGWGKDYDFNKIYNLDKKKKELCNNNNIELLYVVDDKMNYSIPEMVEYRNEIVKFKDLENVYNKRYNKKIQ